MTASIWTGFITSLESMKKENPIMYSMLKQLKYKRDEGGEMILEVENHGLLLFLQKRIPEIETMLGAYLARPASVRLVAEEKIPTVKRADPLLAYTPSIEDIARRVGLNPLYTFENFAVSSSNQIAYAAAQAISEEQSRAYNPLFLYGGVGVGKTHLSQAVARRVLEKDKEKRIVFSTSEHFMNELIESIQQRSTAKFRSKYRKLDLLIIDDVQFIAGKNTAQEEFFHTFNSIVSYGGQIILTADKAPHEIAKLEDRLRSRFSGGLMVDMQPADFELRAAILMIKAREKQIVIDIDIAKLIAEQIADSRALEGALLSIYASSLSRNEPITYELVEAYFRSKTTNLRQTARLNPTDVIRTVCNYYNVKPVVLRSPLRAERVVLPRQVVMYLLKTHINLKHQEIADILKRKDHTTVMHGVEKITRLLIKDVEFKQEVDRIVQLLTSSA